MMLASSKAISPLYLPPTEAVNITCDESNDVVYFTFYINALLVVFNSSYLNQHISRIFFRGGKQIYAIYKSIPTIV